MTTNDYGLGRRVSVDQRDQRYLMTDHLTAVPERSWRYWYPGPTLDQGTTPQCVGYSWSQWLMTSPTRTKDGPAPSAIYHEAQERDIWPGNNYDGTSVRAGAKALEERGHIERYVWAFDAKTVADWILTTGSVVAGLTWTERMFTPDRDGFIYPDGRTVGGHAILLIGVNMNDEKIRIQNSWGQWGQNGRAWIRFQDFADLLADGGECCAAIERSLS